MGDWSLPRLLSKVHVHIEHRLATARKVFGYPVTKGDVKYAQVKVESVSQAPIALAFRFHMPGYLCREDPGTHSGTTAHV